MKIIKSSIILIVLVAFLTSCNNKQNSELQVLPKTVDFVFTFNPHQLQSKSGIKNIAETNAYKKFTENMSPENEKYFNEFDYIFQNSEESGIDLNKNVFFFENNQHKGFLVSMGTSFKLANSDKFTSLMKKIISNNGDTIKINIENNINYIIINNKGKKKILAWNKTIFIGAILSNGRINISHFKKYYLSLFTQNLNNSLANNTDFETFYSKRKDLNLWFGSDFIMSKIPQQYRMIVQMQAPIKLEGIGYHFYTDFQNGKAVIESELILPDDLKNLIENYKIVKETFDKRMLEIIPQKSIFNLSFAINPYEFYKMIEKLYAERQIDTKGMEQMFESSTNIKLEKILKAFSGDVIINIHDVKINVENNDSSKYADKHLTAKWMYSIAVKMDDKDVYNWAVNKFKKNKLELVDGYYTINNSYLAMVDNYVMLTNDKNIIVNFTKRGTLKHSLANSDIGKHLEKYPIYSIINMNYKYSKDAQFFIDTSYNDKFNMKNKLSDIKYVPESSYKAAITFDFNDKNTNSLKQIINNN